MLLQNTPATAALFSKRLAMESVSKTLRNYMFEEIVPNSIIEKRSNASQNQFLVSWLDGERANILYIAVHLTSIQDTNPYGLMT